MGTRNFTSVIMGGEQVVCQYCQWDGYPSWTGVKVLEFLRNADMEQFKKALENTRISLTGYDEYSTYTGSIKKVGDILNKVEQKQREFNDAHKEAEWIGTYETMKRMLKNGLLSEQEADDFVVATRDTGVDILSYIYERSLDKEPLELCACEDEYSEVCAFALDPNYKGVPGCDAQGYYIIDLDKGIVKMNFDEYGREYHIDNLPQNIDLEMLVFEKAIYHLYEREMSEQALDMRGLSTLADEIAVAIGNEIKEEYPEVLEDSNIEVRAENFGKQYIFEMLCEEVLKTQNVEPSLDDIVAGAVSRVENTAQDTAFFDKDEVVIE